MTTIKEVEKALSIFENPLAKQWLNNDVVKKMIAKSYDDWMADVWDHHFPISLEQHIETCLDMPESLGFKIPDE